MTTNFVILLLAFAATDDVGSAIDDVVDSARIYEPASALVRRAPSYPNLELKDGNEGWVQVAYCIDENGKPQNIKVLDSIGSRRFENAAIRSVEKWEFEPATIDGKASWQSGNQSYITFAIEDKTGASRSFAYQFKKLGQLIRDNKIDDADALFTSLLNAKGLSLYEQAKLWAQRVRLEVAAGDLYAAHMALTRATASQGQWIEKESYEELLNIRIKVETNLGLYASLLRSYRELVKSAGEDHASVIALQPLIQNVEELIDGEQVLSTPAEVRTRDTCSYCDNSYYFRPARNSFSIADVNGTLSSIEMHCQHRRYESKISDLVQWNIPDSWGSCYVQIRGEPGTTMNILQLPDGFQEERQVSNEG